MFIGSKDQIRDYLLVKISWLVWLTDIIELTWLYLLTIFVFDNKKIAFLGLASLKKYVTNFEPDKQTTATSDKNLGSERHYY